MSRGVRSELAGAVARVGQLYERVPEDHRPDINGERWHALEAAVDRAAGAGDRVAALQAIEEWEAHARRVLTPLAALEEGRQP